MTETRWDDMTKEERRAAVLAAGERAHQREYEGALALAGREGPAWADLSEEKRASIRAINREHQQEMDELGQAISRGEVPTGLTINTR